jgi:hypothetical protein
VGVAKLIRGSSGTQVIEKIVANPQKIVYSKLPYGLLHLAFRQAVYDSSTPLTGLLASEFGENRVANLAMPQRLFRTLLCSFALVFGADLGTAVQASIEVSIPSNKTEVESFAIPLSAESSNSGVSGNDPLNLPSLRDGTRSAGKPLAPQHLSSVFVSFQVPAPSSVIADWPLAGDFDRNYCVDGADLGEWVRDYGSGVSSNAYPSGYAGGQDFLAWQRGLGQAEGAAPAVSSAPEPATLVMWSVLTGSAACIFYCRLRRPS